MSIKNEFFSRVQTKVEGIKEVYKCSDILIKEDIDTGICKAYSMQNGKKINNEEIRIFLANIEDERDIISYKMLFLPGGRCKNINEQERSSLYTFCSLSYALSGEDVSSYAMVTKDKVNDLIRLYQSQKQFMKYIELEKVRINGNVAYIGKYIKNGVVKQEELFGNVISNIDINNIAEAKVLANNRCLQDFKSENNSLTFTTRALQTIVDRERKKII